ncbi:MAG TPA: diguanylate cyclase [Clostridiaceae bacterium]|nr:diguanylate cyclase [Clostridiaceae bacterium]
MRRLMTILAPLIVLFAAWALASKAELYSEAVQSLILVVPYIIAVLALFMSVWYQNSNSFYLVLFILVSHIFIVVSQKKIPMLNEATTMVSILLPLNTLWLSFSKERGVFSSYGRKKALIILVQLVWIFIFIMIKSGVPVTSDMAETFKGIKVPAVVIYIISVGLLLSCYILKSVNMNIIYVAVLLASVISLYFANRLILSSIFTSAIFVIVVIALFDVSYSLAFYDPLTGVYSRRALEQELLKLGNKRYAIAMVDLDHFKKINDTYGHDIGDEVLKMVASVLQKNSGHGKVFRYGGEEFVILFSRTNYNEIMPLLERIRRAVERRPFIIRADNRPAEKPDKNSITSSAGKGKINITISIGVAQKTDLMKSCFDVIRKADEALYKSKNSGRNCVTKI